MNAIEETSKWVKKCAECGTGPFFLDLENAVKHDLREAELYLLDKHFTFQFQPVSTNNPQKFSVEIQPTADNQTKKGPLGVYFENHPQEGTITISFLRRRPEDSTVETLRPRWDHETKSCRLYWDGSPYEPAEVSYRVFFPIFFPHQPSPRYTLDNL